MKDTGYFVTFRETEAVGDREGLITMLRFDDKVHFDDQLRRGCLKNKLVVERDITEARAREICSESLQNIRARAVRTLRETRRETSRTDRLMTQLRSDPKILAILSRPHQSR